MICFCERLPCNESAPSQIDGFFKRRWHFTFIEEHRINPILLRIPAAQLAPVVCRDTRKLFYPAGFGSTRYLSLSVFGRDINPMALPSRVDFKEQQRRVVGRASAANAFE